MKAKLAGILLSISLLAPIASTLMVYTYQKKQVKRCIKRRIMAGIDRSELVFFQFSKEESESELNWKHSKEFEYKGQMYDIVERESLGDSVLYWCWWDHEETKLNKQLKSILHYSFRNNRQRKQNKQLLVKLYKSLFFEAAEKENTLQTQAQSLVFHYQCTYQSISHAPPSPPPQVI